MGDDHDRPGRRSIRLRDYDYTAPGAYFVTICTHHGQCIFDDPFLRSVAEAGLRDIPRHAPHVNLDAWVVMPNHVHAILMITDTVGARHSQVSRSVQDSPDQPSDPSAPSAVRGNASPLQPGSLGAIVGNFKSVAARRINTQRGSPGARVWQRNYYEHIIRNDRALQRIRGYIANNPACWDADVENPHHRGSGAAGFYARIWGEPP